MITYWLKSAHKESKLEGDCQWKFLVLVIGKMSVNISICYLGKISRSTKFTDNNYIEKILSIDGMPYPGKKKKKKRMVIIKMFSNVTA